MAGKEGQEFGRLITASVTAFDEDGKVSFERNRDLARHLARDSQSIVSVGTTGESPNITERERMTLLNAVKEGAGERVKVIAGTGTNSTDESVELSILAQKEGADGLLIVVPPYNKPSQLGLLRHVGRIANAVDLPIIVYNVPSRTVTNMDAETVLALDREFGNVVGLKEAVGLKSTRPDGRAQIALVLEGRSDGFEVWSGNDEDTLPMMRMGAYGVVSVASHLAGDLINRMMEHHLARNDWEAQQLHDHLMPLFSALFPPESPEASPASVKAMLNLSGMPVGSLRGPLLNILKEDSYREHRDRLQALVAEYNFVTSPSK